jgi:long-chain acyl-CoA synthetase
MPNSAELVVSFMATIRCGAVALPMNPQYKEWEIESHLDSARPSVIVAQNSLTPMVNQVLANRHVVNPVLIGCPDGKGAWYGFPELIEHHRPAASAPSFDTSSPALWLYSSGSTGGSKRVSRTRAHLANEAEAFRRTANVTAEDVILCVVPLTHAHGLGNGLLAAAYAGARLIVHERFDRRRMLKTIEEERVTLIPGGPFMYRILADTPVLDEPDLSSVRLAFSAGAPLTRETFDAFRDRYGIEVRQLYGATETGAVSINLSDDIDESALSVGAPLDGVSIDIFDSKGNAAPIEEEGAVGIRSPAMFEGYDNREDLNDAAFRDGYFFPGDRGYKDARGRITLVGRETLFINLGGNKVDPGEVEAVLNAHPQVEESVVLGVKQRSGDEIVKAVIVPRVKCEEAEILAFCRERIADFKIPRIVEFREELPRNPLGKVLRKYLA